MRQIKIWINESKPKTHESFPRIPSLTPDEKEIMEGELSKEENKQQWRRDPPLDITSRIVATFLWPEENDKPDVYLGRNYEALDPIRMDDSCWITYDRANSSFKVMGDDSTEIKSAVRRLRAIVYQIAARAIDTMDLSLVRPGVELYSQVQFISYESDSIQRSGAAKFIAKIDPGSLVDSNSHDAASVDNINEANSRKLQKLIMKTLVGLRYYPGNIKMVARYGTFITRRHIDVKTLEDWQAMLKQPECESEVTVE